MQDEICAEGEFLKATFNDGSMNHPRPQQQRQQGSQQYTDKQQPHSPGPINFECRSANEGLTRALLPDFGTLYDSFSPYQTNLFHLNFLSSPERRDRGTKNVHRDRRVLKMHV